MNKLVISRKAKFATAFCASVALVAGALLADDPDPEVDPEPEPDPQYSDYTTIYDVPDAQKAAFGDIGKDVNVVTNQDEVNFAIMANLTASRVTSDNSRLVNVIRDVEAADYLWVPNVDGEGHGILYKRMGTQDGRICYVSVTNVNLKANGIIPRAN